MELSIQFSLDGFSFCISNLENKKTLYFSEYTFKETQNSPKELLNKIKIIFKEDHNLQHEFTSVVVIHENNLNTLVPNLYFNEALLKTYLDYNIKTLKTDFIAFDDVENFSLKNVYVPYVNINNYLFQNFGEFEYKHHTTVFLEKLRNVKKFDEKIMFVNVSTNNCYIVVLDNNNLLFSNSFTYQTKEDFLYYLLFTAEQLELDTNTFKLYFSGLIDTTSEIYKIAFTYIRNIYFLEGNNAILEDVNTPKHANYILLG